jgi:hypothetical protein
MPSELNGGASTAKSTMSGTSKKSKKKVDPISLEEVFNKVSNVNASGLNPPPGRIVLTPRSAEVCLKLGINPDVIKIRDIDSFWEPGIEPSVQRMRHEAYVQRRYETMKECRMERKRLMNAEFEAATTIAPTSTALTPEQLLEKQKELTSSLVATEMARIKKMQKRQEKELDQMIQYEVNRAKVAQDMEMRIQAAKKKDELRKKQQEKRLKLTAEERRLKELQKAALEEVEEENRKALAHDMHVKEMELAAQRARKEKNEKVRRRELEVERKLKLQEQQAKVAKFFADEQARMRANLETLHLAEEKKQAAQNEKQAALKAELSKRRAAIEKRIETNMKVARMVEQKRKDDFETKQEAFERKRLEQMTKEEEARNLHIQEVQLQEQRRRLILIQKRKEEEIKAESMLEQFEEEEIHVLEVQEAREHGQQMLKEKQALRKQMKLENVERVRRVNEYKRMNILKSIEDKDARVTKMMSSKNSLIEDRRKAGQKTRLQKEKIAAVMEEVRTNATKAQQLITKAMTGSVTLDSLIGTQDKKKKKKKGTMRSTSDILGDTNGMSMDEMEAQGFDASKEYGATGGDGSSTYKSPYEGQTVDL